MIIIVAPAIGMYFTKTPQYLKRLFKELTWDIEENESVYLTFDDGPVPGVTDKVLDMLLQHQMKATFFCLGKQVQRYPELYKRILEEGHAVGNHSFHHVNGWKTDTSSYQSDVEACSLLVESQLFRPPYGRITLPQMKALSQDYRIIMWDVLSGDFDEKRSAETCFNMIKRHMQAGSIVVFHDSEKAAPRMLPTLQKTLQLISEMNLKAKPLQAEVWN